MPRSHPITVQPAQRIYWAVGVASSPDTNSPAAKQEWLGATNRRQRADLTGRTQARLSWQASGVTGGAGSKLSIQYSTDAGVSWKYLDDTADGVVGAATPQVAYDTALGTLATSAWGTIAKNARTDVLLRVVTSGGDGIADPVTFWLWLEVR